MTPWCHCKKCGPTPCPALLSSFAALLDLLCLLRRAGLTTTSSGVVYCGSDAFKPHTASCWPLQLRRRAGEAGGELCVDTHLVPGPGSVARRSNTSAMASLKQAPWQAAAAHGGSSCRQLRFIAAACAALRVRRPSFRLRRVRCLPLSRWSSYAASCAWCVRRGTGSSRCYCSTTLSRPARPALDWRTAPG